VEDFLRWMQPGVIATLGGLLVVFVGTWIVNAAVADSQDPDAQRIVALVNRWRNIVAVVLLLASLVQIVFAASVNNVPRSTIDRSDVNRQTDQRFR